MIDVNVSILFHPADNLLHYLHLRFNTLRIADDRN